MWTGKTITKVIKFLSQRILSVKNYPLALKITSSYWSKINKNNICGTLQRCNFQCEKIFKETCVGF